MKNGSLTDVLGLVNAKDQELLEKQAEADIAAEEEAYAGRITARGFSDELNKLAGPMDAPAGSTDTIKAAPPKPPAGAGAMPSGAGKPPGAQPAIPKRQMTPGGAAFKPGAQSVSPTGAPTGK